MFQKSANLSNFALSVSGHFFKIMLLHQLFYNQLGLLECIFTRYMYQTKIRKFTMAKIRKLGLSQGWNNDAFIKILKRFWLNEIRFGSNASRDLPRYQGHLKSSIWTHFHYQDLVKKGLRRPKLGVFFSVKLSFNGFYCPKW